MPHLLLRNGQFNCSTSEYPVFSEHLRCNGVRQCDGGQDEERCPHRPEECQGNFRFNDKCYVYVTENATQIDVTNNVCTEKGWSERPPTTAR